MSLCHQAVRPPRETEGYVESWHFTVSKKPIKNQCTCVYLLVWFLTCGWQDWAYQDSVPIAAQPEHARVCLEKVYYSLQSAQ